MRTASTALLAGSIGLVIGLVGAGQPGILSATLGGSEDGVDPFFPTLSVGDRGTDVETLQWLLNGTGHDLAANGQYDAVTRDAVAAFEAAVGLPVDGISGVDTWQALVPLLKVGDTGAHVVALQAALSKVEPASVATGTFDVQTVLAVTAFQDDMGLPATGIADAETWEALVWKYEYYALPDCDDLEDIAPGDRPAACIYNDMEDQWGKASMVAHLRAAVDAFAQRGLGPVAFADLSLEYGGDIEHHSTHEQGLDADVALIHKDGDQWDKRCDVDDACYDPVATRALIDDIVATGNGHIVRIYFRDIDLDGYHGVVRYEEGHEDHLHIRYCEPMHPVSKYDDCWGALPAEWMAPPAL